MSVQNLRDVEKIITSSVPLENAESCKMNKSKVKCGLELLNEELKEPIRTPETKAACAQQSPYVEEDIVHDIKTCLDKNENKVDNIFITRVIENVNPLRKDVPHLNSTENIISEYDAAMSYKTESYGVSKSDLNLDLNGNGGSQKISVQNQFELSRDDSDVHLKTESKTKAEKDMRPRMNKSEGNLADAVKKERFNRQSSLISSLTSTSFQWNFSYSSPYALTEKEKQAILERKIRMKKKRRQLERRKREEKEQRERENAVAFENWKQRKRAETASSSEKAVTGPLASRKSNRYKYWYPY